MFPTPLQSWLCFLILFITTVAVLSLAFTHPKSHQRDAASLLVICLYILFYRDTQFLQNETLKIALNTFSIIQIGHIVRIVSVDRLSYIPEQLQHANHSKVAISTTDGRRFSWALSAVFNFRAIHTTEQAKGTPRFHRGHINYVPSRMRFLSVKCLTLTVRILILAVWGGGWPLLHLPDDCAAPKEYLFSRLGDVTPQEVVQRTWATFLFWLRGYLNHSTAYDLISVVCVASKQSNPISWPPMYGSLTDSYTIRGWWGATWHQLLRKQLTSFSDFILSGLLALQKGSVLYRYGSTVLVFGISGLYHILSDGIQVKSGVVRFFLMQAAAVIVEDTVQELHRKSRLKLRREVPTMVGYVWVVTFLVWTSPGWRYPVLVHRFSYKA